MRVGAAGAKNRRISMKHTVNIDGATVSFRVDGSGPGLLLLHGAGGNGDTNWGSVVQPLSETRLVVRPDYSGSGETIDGGGPLSIPMLAAQAVAAARQAGAAPFDLVGFSLGAIVATYMAAEYPDLVRSVVLLAGSPVSGDARQTHQFELWRDLVRTNRGAMARLLMLSALSPDFLAAMDHRTVSQFVDDIVATNNWGGLARQLELLIAHDVSEQARRITQPTLVIGCTQDVLMPLGHSRTLADLIPKARYEELNTGHLAAIEQPSELTTLLIDFIEGGPGILKTAFPPI
jgi:3-oxoadipate enol-lactonase